MMRINTISHAAIAIALGVGILASTTPASAHHAFAAEFDANKKATLKGVLTKVAAALEAKRKYREFTAADVSPGMIAPELHIYASSNHSGPTTYDVELIVIMPKGQKDMSALVRPLRTEEVGELYRNLLGAEFEGKGMLAVFPLTMFANDHELRIVRQGSDNEVRAKIDVKKQFR